MCGPMLSSSSALLACMFMLKPPRVIVLIASGVSFIKLVRSSHVLSDSVIGATMWYICRCDYDRVAMHVQFHSNQTARYLPVVVPILVHVILIAESCSPVFSASAGGRVYKGVPLPYFIT